MALLDVNAILLAKVSELTKRIEELEQKAPPMRVCSSMESEAGDQVSSTSSSTSPKGKLSKTALKDLGKDIISWLTEDEKKLSPKLRNAKAETFPDDVSCRAAA